MSTDTSSVDALRTRLARAFEVAALRDPSAELAAFEAAVRHEHGERIAVAADELCPHEADSHAEGTCDLCDYAFAVGELARDLSPPP